MFTPRRPSSVGWRRTFRLRPSAFCFLPTAYSAAPPRCNDAQSDGIVRRTHHDFSFGDRRSGIVRGNHEFEKQPIACLVNHRVGMASYIFGATLTPMIRFLARCRRLVSMSGLILLVTVVCLSTATRRPCLSASTAPWHLWKAGCMRQPGTQETNVHRARAQSQSEQTASKALPSDERLAFLRRSEAPPRPLSIILQIRHFRSPPHLS